jgi:WD40 repeat protein
VQILKGHLATKPVRSLAFSPDGTKLASSARDYKTFLWDLATGKHEVIEESGSYYVAFSPGGDVVATGGWMTAFWDVRDRVRTKALPPEWNDAPRLAFSPDGKALASVSSRLRVWDFAAAAERDLSLDAGLADGRSLAFSRDGGLLATGHSHGNGRGYWVILWDAHTWQVRSRLSGPTATIESLSFSPDGRRLAGCGHRTLWIWDVASGEIVHRHVVGAQSFKGVKFSPDGRLLAFAHNDATVTFLSAGTWTQAAAYDFRIGPMICLDFAPDGMRVAAGSGKGKIVVFDVDV